MSTLATNSLYNAHYLYALQPGKIVTRRIAVAGAGYVGLAMSALLAQKHSVLCCDIDSDRVALLNRGELPIADPEISEFLASRSLDLTFTDNPAAAYTDVDLVIVATPTDYDPLTNGFDTDSVTRVVQDALSQCPDSTIAIKSTVPVGYTDSLRKQFASDRVIFSPEFLREGRALYDNLYPSRIVVGGNSDARSLEFGEIVKDLALRDEVPVVYLKNIEAEAVKLFSNTYLAVRIAYFNELDSFALAHSLDTQNVIEAVCLDPRIGGGYNNPSFGYGGYCLPKDTKQLLGTYHDIPQAIISAVVDSNNRRMDHIANDILSKRPQTVGIYRLSMKADSDNFRESSVVGVMERLIDRGVSIIVYEPTIEVDEYNGTPVVHDLQAFADRADVIVANRLSEELDEFSSKIYSRDIFGVN